MAFKNKRSRYFDKNIDANKDEEPFPRSVNSVLKKSTANVKIKKKVPNKKKDKKELAIKRKEINKKRQEKKRRLIIRNLSFKVNEEELKNALSKFGTVVEVTIPKSKDGKARGFAFAQFDNFPSTIKAIKNLNFKEIHGRKVAIDYAISKDKYDHVVSSRKVSDLSNTSIKSEDSESESDSAEPEIKQEPEDGEDSEGEPDNKKTKLSEKDNEVAQLLKELDFKPESDDEENSSQDPESESSSDDEFESEEESKPIKSEIKIKTEGGSEDVPKEGLSRAIDRSSSKDVHEGKTVFMRNISFETVEDDLKEAVSEFGPISYCVFCIDPVTEMPRGTAFVKFEEKDDADKLIAKSESEDGLYLDGRKLYCSLALSREEVQNKLKGKVKEKKDKRNLYLLKEGLIMSNSEEAKDLSPADLAKRAKLEASKKQKLKNLNFFVSPTRLCVHNIPAHFKDLDLRKLFKNAAGHNAVITEARVMKDFKKLNAKGEPKSKGFGFVAFNRHEDALQALRTLDNHPTAFHPQNRPIVEFAIENHLVLLSKQRRQERSKLKAKSVNNEESKSKNAASHGSFKNEKIADKNKSVVNKSTTPLTETRKRNRKRKAGKIPCANEVSSDKTPSPNTKRKNKKVKTEEVPSTLSPKSGKRKNKRHKAKTGTKMNVDGLRNLADSYKTKLMNAM